MTAKVTAYESHNFHTHQRIQRSFVPNHTLKEKLKAAVEVHGGPRPSKTLLLGFPLTRRRSVYSFCKTICITVILTKATLPFKVNSPPGEYIHQWIYLSLLDRTWHEYSN